MTEYTARQLRERYESLTFRVEAHCTLIRDLTGGQPANEDGIRAFVTHHLKLAGEEADAAVQRIKAEEIDKAPPEGELEEKLTYGLNVVRKDMNGPWLGDWMVKACLKAAASRVGLFQTVRGTKGDMAEMGRVHATAESLITEPWKIYLRNADGGPASTHFEELRGKVSTMQGSRSIINHVEKVEAGSIFSFEFRAYSGRFRESDIVSLFAAASQIGLGSAKAFECGKFEISRMLVDMATAPEREKKRKGKPVTGATTEELVEQGLGRGA